MEPAAYPPAAALAAPDQKPPPAPRPGRTGFAASARIRRICATVFAISPRIAV
ncbi:hypothetical protein HED51_11405 [Ochrobactrum grignonense]|nr:hypothetical protein [Brucella grignonensis]